MYHDSLLAAGTSTVLLVVHKSEAIQFADKAFSFSIDPSTSLCCCSHSISLKP